MHKTHIIAVLALAMAGCGPSATGTVVPKTVDLPPLPRSITSSVGLLLENGSGLLLSEEQGRMLRDIDAKLAADNQPMDEELAMMDERRSKMAERRGRGSKSKSKSRAGGGMRGGGGRGGGGGMRGGGGGMRGGQRPTAKSPRPDMEQAKQRYRERENSLHAQKLELNQDALADAWTLLSVEQQDAAQTILEKHGHEGPTTLGEFSTTGSETG